jgi:NitT/TauT family transport system permease protein
MRRSALWGSLILLLLWFLITTTGLVSRLFLPSPIAVFKELYLLIISYEIIWDVLATLQRTLFGFLIGCVFGIGLGLIMGYYKIVYQTMEFPVDFFRSIPATALFPLFIVIWGLGDQVKIFIAAWASSMVVLINTIYGIRNVAIIRLMVAKTKKASFFKTFYKVIIPDALSYIFAGFRIALSLALVVELVAEMFLGSQNGLGRRIFNASSIFQMEEAYAAVMVVGLLGYFLNKTIILLERRIVHWSGR